ncbi:LOW QUALITY PROTEIN: uncharacterized protein LOC135210189 [Macrobrachium nipponense]|uniref:LOW QUALITY PROTEIN: uncharacterized protein LOC135210189 n=1 Tax=Macrobrachium nipponense TaxID=159736 RepID=UPI0030C8CA12
MADTDSGLHITHLAEEIVLKILGYLAVEDLFRISLTCSFFSRLVCDREVVRELDFSKAYTYTTEDLKAFLVPRKRCLHISTLNLSNCYWIKASNFIVKLKNLQSLQMNAVPLTFVQFEAILKACPKIEDLSICWPEDAVPVPLSKWKETVDKIDEVQNVIKNMHSVRALVNFNFAHFMVFLKRCHALRRLVITGHHSRRFCVSASSHSENQDKWNFRLPYLEKLVVDLEDVMFPIPYLGGILSGAKSDENDEKGGDDKQKKPVDWKICWINNRYPAANMELISGEIFSKCSRLYLGLTLDSFEKIKSLGVLPNIRELMVVGAAAVTINLTSIVTSCPNLQSLNVLFGLNIALDITKVFEKLPDIEKLSLHCQPLQGPPKIASGIAQFHNLTHLSVPVCALIEIRSKEKRQVFEEEVDYTDCISFKRRRVGSRESATVELAAFNEVFENCSKIKMLQIGFNQEISCSPLKVQWECLSNMKKLESLTKLTLDSIPITSGGFLIEIAKECTKLEFLRLKRLGPSGKCVYTAQLAESLPFCKNLVHLRVEQNYLAPGTNIFKALEECPKLQRFALLSEKDVMALNLDAVEHLIQNHLSLIFVFILGGMLTRDKSVKLMRKYKNLESRPALIVRVKNILRDVFDDKIKITIQCRLATSMR